MRNLMGDFLGIRGRDFSSGDKIFKEEEKIHKNYLQIFKE